jgi:hypothetical protein
MEHAVAVIVRHARVVIVPVIVFHVPVRVGVHGAVEVLVHVRVVVVWPIVRRDVAHA